MTDVSHAALSSGFTLSNHVTGSPPASISQSGVAVRSRVNVVPSKRASTENSAAGSSATFERSKQSKLRPPATFIR